LKTIREWRLERGWSQNDLAVRLGVTPTTIYNWERGKNEPSASMFRRLALALGVSMDVIALVEKGERR
jgi:transcriptional regulator with XRE-family HTH domain